MLGLDSTAAFTGLTASGSDAASAFAAFEAVSAATGEAAALEAKSDAFSVGAATWSEDLAASAAGLAAAVSEGLEAPLGEAVLLLSAASWLVLAVSALSVVATDKVFNSLK